MLAAPGLRALITAVLTKSRLPRAPAAVARTIGPDRLNHPVAIFGDGFALHKITARCTIGGGKSDLVRLPKTRDASVEHGLIV
jgi:hypothetical protein